LRIDRVWAADFRAWRKQQRWSLLHRFRFCTWRTWTSTIYEARASASC